MRVSRFPWTPALLAAGAGLLAASQWLVFAYAPIEEVMGPIQKIFYIHLPLAWWGLVSFFVVFVCSIACLAKKEPAYDRTARAAAEIGVLFTTLCLATGMIWGRRAWGVWWTWDPRLSTALVMWFVYVAYLILESLGTSPERRRLVRSAVGIVAFLDVPLVFLSARMWRSIHPAVFASESGGLEPEMKLAAIFCTLAMGVFWLGLLLFRKTQLDQAFHIDRLLFRLEERGEKQ
ncbi:MAG: cytochrome c biogenesis protein CcsA [Desulfovibrio sp.]|nr:cytochrome c biogenesis protein CcsA [Desulfovibrio sp.]